MPQRLVRRAPLRERILSCLDPLDFLMWLSQEVEANDWEDFHRRYSTPLALGLNLTFLIARANHGRSGAGARAWSRGDVDDVFGDDSYGEARGSGWFSWFASSLVLFLTLFSVLNAIYTFKRKRHYRLFESSVEVAPSTPSAHRVRVHSSPVSSSPLRFLSDMISATTSSMAAEARAHPDASRDVWELGVWDPLPICLRLFCLFSPGHVLVYWLFLPTSAHDPRPSTTILTTIVLGVLLSAQLYVLQSSFSQQTKDTAVIHKEVLNEYDTKFVHPRTNGTVRDAGTQFGERESGSALNFVHIYTPTTLINRGFRTNPNPNYAKHYDPDSMTGSINVGANLPPASRFLTPTQVPLGPQYQSTQTPSCTQDMLSSPLRKQPSFPSASTAGTGDGGSLGVYTHANSPLKKHLSSGSIHHGGPSTTSNIFDAANTGPGAGTRPRSPIKREGSPLKRTTLPGTTAGAGGAPTYLADQSSYPSSSSLAAGAVPNGDTYGQTSRHSHNHHHRQHPRQRYTSSAAIASDHYRGGGFDEQFSSKTGKTARQSGYY